MTWGQALPLMAVIIVGTVCAGALIVVYSVVKNAAASARELASVERRLIVQGLQQQPRP